MVLAGRLHAQATLSPEKKNRRPVGTQSWSGRCVEERTSLSYLFRESNKHYSDAQPIVVAIPSMLGRLLDSPVIYQLIYMCDSFLLFNGALSYLFCRLRGLICMMNR